MCGIETMPAPRATPITSGEGRGTSHDGCPTPGVLRVPPLQAGGGGFGPGSQGVALGYRIIAPSARGATATRRQRQVALSAVRAERLKRFQPEGLELVSPGQRSGDTAKPRFSSPNGARFTSPGQRPGNSAPHPIIRPEGALPATGHTHPRDLEQTIARNVAEIPEA